MFYFTFKKIYSTPLVFRHDIICNSIKSFLLNITEKHKQIKNNIINPNIYPEHIISVLLGNTYGPGFLQLCQQEINKITTYEIYLSQLLSTSSKQTLLDNEEAPIINLNVLNSVNQENIKLYLKIYLNFDKLREKEKVFLEQVVIETSSIIFYSVNKFDIMQFLVTQIINMFQVVQDNLWQVTSFLGNRSYHGAPYYFLIKHLSYNVIQHCVASSMFNDSFKLSLLGHLLLITPTTENKKINTTNQQMEKLKQIYKNNKICPEKYLEFMQTLHDILNDSRYFLTKQDIEFLIEIFKYTNKENFRMKRILYSIRMVNKSVIHSAELFKILNNLENQLQEKL